MKKKYIISIILLLIISFGYWIVSNDFFMYEKVPNLYDTRWKSISVEYLFDKCSIKNKETWSTTDQQILNKIQESLHIKYSGDLWGYASVGSVDRNGDTFNKIDLELNDGRKYELDFGSETEMGLDDHEITETGFRLEVTSDFHDVLKEIIQNTQKRPIYLYKKDSMYCE